MYLLINCDNTINYGNDHPINERLNFDGVTIVEFPDKTLAEVVGDISPAEAYWDEENQKVIVNPVFAMAEEKAERAWRDNELTRTISKLDQYDRDCRIPSEFRTSGMTEYDYHELLRYRKKLCEYPESPNYALRIRPTHNK